MTQPMHSIARLAEISDGILQREGIIQERRKPRVMPQGPYGKEPTSAPMPRDYKDLSLDQTELVLAAMAAWESKPYNRRPPSWWADGRESATQAAIHALGGKLPNFLKRKGLSGKNKLEKQLTRAGRMVGGRAEDEEAPTMSQKALTNMLTGRNRSTYSNIAEGNPDGSAVTYGHNRYSQTMDPATKDKVLQARVQEIEEFARDRNLPLPVVFGVAEAALRTGRVPELGMYGLAGDDAMAVKHFMAGSLLNIAGMEAVDWDGTPIQTEAKGYKEVVWHFKKPGSAKKFYNLLKRKEGDDWSARLSRDGLKVMVSVVGGSGGPSRIEDFVDLDNLASAHHGKKLKVRFEDEDAEIEEGRKEGHSASASKDTRSWAKHTPDRQQHRAASKKRRRRGKQEIRRQLDDTVDLAGGSRPNAGGNLGDMDEYAVARSRQARKSSNYREDDGMTEAQRALAAYRGVLPEEGSSYTVAERPASRSFGDTPNPDAPGDPGEPYVQGKISAKTAAKLNNDTDAVKTTDLTTAQLRRLARERGELGTEGVDPTPEEILQINNGDHRGEQWPKVGRALDSMLSMTGSLRRGGSWGFNGRLGEDDEAPSTDESVKGKAQRRMGMDPKKLQRKTGKAASASRRKGRGFSRPQAGGGEKEGDAYYRGHSQKKRPLGDDTQVEHDFHTQARALGGGFDAYDASGKGVYSFGNEAQARQFADQVGGTVKGNQVTVSEKLKVKEDEAISFVATFAEAVLDLLDDLTEGTGMADYMSPDQIKRVSKMFYSASQDVQKAHFVLSQALPRHTWPVQLSKHLRDMTLAFMDGGDVNIANRAVEKMRGALGRKSEIPPKAKRDLDRKRGMRESRFVQFGGRGLARLGQTRATPVQIESQQQQESGHIGYGGNFRGGPVGGGGADEAPPSDEEKKPKKPMKVKEALDAFQSNRAITESAGKMLWKQLHAMKISGVPLLMYLGGKSKPKYLRITDSSVRTWMGGKWKGIVVIDYNRGTDLYDVTFLRIRKFEEIIDAKVLGVEVGNLSHVLERYVYYGEARGKKGKVIRA